MEVGTWALGRVTPLDLPFSPACKWHIFRVSSPPQPVSYGCGQIQTFHCLVCDYTSPLLSADMFRPATAQEIQFCLLHLQDRVSHELTVIGEYQNYLAGIPSQEYIDFDE